MATALEPESIEAKVKVVRSIVGSEISYSEVFRALFLSNNNAVEAADLILGSPSLKPHLTAYKTLTPTCGTRVQVNEGLEGDGLSVDGLNVVKQECLSVETGEVPEGEREGSVVDECDMGIGSAEVVMVKEEIDNEGEAESRVKKESFESGEVAGSIEGDMKGSVLKKCNAVVGDMEVLKVKEEPDVGFVKGEEGLGDGNKGLGGDRSLVLAGTNDLKQEMASSAMSGTRVKEEPEADLEVTSGTKAETRVKEKPNVDVENKSVIAAKKTVQELISVQPLSSRKLSDGEYRRMQSGNNNPKPKRVRAEEMILSSVVIEDGDFPEDPAWLLVGRNVVTGISTTRGRKLENNEIVHFAFPNANTRTKISTHFMSSKAANAASSIVRFSTKRNGEVYLSARDILFD